jgi:hypothetical protein
MAVIEQTSLDVPHLSRLVRGVDPTALLVPSRVLRRVIKRDRKIGGVSLLVPHRKTYVVQRDLLLRVADREELGLGAGEVLPDWVILLSQPEADRLAKLPPQEVLFKHWRNLFHARIDLAMRHKLDDGTLNEHTVRARIERLGTTAFDEITLVLSQEDLLLPPEKPETIYAEFVAVYLTLRRFAPAFVQHYFPCLTDLADVDALVSAEVDAETLYQATRLPGAPDPEGQPPNFLAFDDTQGWTAEALELTPAIPLSPAKISAVLAQAEQADARGNVVRAAILRTRAAEGANLTNAGGRAELSRLSDRLRQALELTDADAESWRRALLPLLARAARGIWSQEARFLYDLQKVCVDSERGIYAVDVVEWALSLGAKPIKRPLPNYREVAIVRHLRRALDRMRRVRVLDTDRERLTELLRHAVRHREKLMRQRFRPLLVDAMNQAGFLPQNVPEQIGRDKLVEELLDRTVQNGHFNMGNLRDGLSRNKLKMPDLKGPAEFFTGDPLIRLNRKLGTSLDGIYRRGEIYMRWLHRISSAAFGTALGRFLMLWLILPFGLAFVIMVAPTLIVEECQTLGPRFVRMIDRIQRPPTAKRPPIGDADPVLGHEGEAGTQPTHLQHPMHMPDPWGWALIGIVFLLVFHVGSFRRLVFYCLGQMGRGLQTVFIHGPFWVMRQPFLQALLHNRFWVLLRRLIFWPCALGGLGLFIGWVKDLDTQITVAMATLLGGIGLGLFNTRMGRVLEEDLTDGLVRLWLWCSVDIVPGLLRLIMDVSRWCLEGVEQVLYTVDEWLRFRGGDSRLSLAAKAVLGVFWFAVTYIVRIYANLLIEPTVNPIKHFPVVTIGHKIMLPFLFVLFHFLRDDVGLGALGPIFGTGFIVVTIFFIPGICGFVMWEMKANWKLYRANRPRNLKPVMIGSHGETMIRLLRPGFHSGTVPKLYRRLRRAERRGQPGTVRKVLAGLHHVEEAVAHFVERELLALLRQSKGWGSLPIELHEIHLATNRVVVSLACPSLGNHPLELAFDQQTGWLVAGVLEQGWLPGLTSEQRQTLAAGLAGLYKMAGVDVNREQIEESLAPARVAYDIKQQGLEVWQAPEYAITAVYDLSAGPTLEPQATNGAPVRGLPTLDTSRLLFSNVPLSWDDWVRMWDRDRGLVNGDRRELAVALLPRVK